MHTHNNEGAALIIPSAPGDYPDEPPHVSEPDNIAGTGEKNAAAVVPPTATAAPENDLLQDAMDHVARTAGNINPKPDFNIARFSTGTKCVLVKVKDLKPHPLSKKIYNPSKSEYLVKSIASIGIVNPLLVLEETNEVVGGTTRLAIAQDLNIEEVPVVYLKGSFTQEEITEILINSNLYRKKTPLEKAREYRELKKYEIATTKSKKSAKGGKNGEVSTLEPRQKSRFKAAERIGGGATSLDKAEKTLNAADKLEAEGNVEAAAELLRILETKTYNAAYKRALELGAIVGKKARKAKPVDGKAVAGPAKPAGVIEAAEIAPKVIAEKPGEELIVDFAAPPLPKEEDPVEVPDAPKVVGSALDAVNAHIAAVKFFLLDIQFRGVPEDMKADLGLAIGEINHLAAAAGVPVKVI